MGRDSEAQGEERSRRKSTEEQSPDRASACGEDSIQFIIQVVPFDSERTCCWGSHMTDVNGRGQAGSGAWPSAGQVSGRCLLLL